MPFFTIAGKPNCPNFAHAILVADYLTERLPSFQYRKFEKMDDDWMELLRQINIDNGWSVLKSPIIWKEITRFGGKPHLIGGASEFWEYCYDYYGLLSIIPRVDLLKLAQDNYRIFQETENAKKRNFLVISFYGHSNLILDFLIMEMRTIFSQNLIIRLFDEDENLKPRKDVVIVTSLKELFNNADLFIIIKDYRPKLEEDEQDYLSKIQIECRYLSDAINGLAKRTLRVIAAHPGPSCYTATILMTLCTSIRLANIVAVTADYGLSAIAAIASITEYPIEKINCPPVWGAPGISSFVDIRNTVVLTEILRPFPRSIKAKAEESNLPMGRIQYELKLFDFIVDEEKVRQKISENETKMRQVLDRAPILAKLRAVVSLLKLWYNKEIGDEIISLGICSNGSFGLPTGVVVSQPAILNNAGIWEPFAAYPIQENARNEILEAVLSFEKMLLTNWHDAHEYNTNV